MNRKNCLFFAVALFCFQAMAISQTPYLSNLHLVTGNGILSNAERSAAVMLAEEINKRTGLQLTVTAQWPASGDIILLQQASGSRRSEIALSSEPALIHKPESFRILTQQQGIRTIVAIEGYDGRGILLGAGELLRNVSYINGGIGLPANWTVSTTPDKAMRGHQLGYRNTANSYDAWTPAQFEQYIRELVIFGTNSIESIPIFDEDKSP